MSLQNELKPPGGYAGKLEYPIEKKNQYNTKIAFQAIRVIPPKIVSLGGSNSGPSIEGGTAPIASATDSLDNLINNISRGSNIQFFNIPGERADLHVPIGGFQVNDGFDYAATSLGTLGAVGAASLNASGNIAEAASKTASELGQSFLDAFSIISGDASIARLAALKGTTLMPIGDKLRNAAQITTRVTLNPNIRTNFNGVAPREFNFVFQFVPNSSQESIAVKSIIKFFRYHAYPDQIGGFGDGAFSVGFEYPDLFRIQLLSGSGGQFQRIGTPIKLSYLKAISTTYNPTSPALHADGAPTEISMGLTFVEYKAQTRQDIRDEDNNNFYHFENGQSLTGEAITKAANIVEETIL